MDGKILGKKLYLNLATAPWNNDKTSLVLRQHGTDGVLGPVDIHPVVALLPQLAPALVLEYLLRGSTTGFKASPLSVPPYLCDL